MASSELAKEKNQPSGLGRTSSSFESQDQRKKSKEQQNRMMKKMVKSRETGNTEDNSRQAAKGGEGRAVLAWVNGHDKQQKVGDVRVGVVKVDSGPGALLASREKKTGRGSDVIAFAIFQDAEKAPPSDIHPTSELGSSSSSKEVIPVQKECKISSKPTFSVRKTKSVQNSRRSSQSGNLLKNTKLRIRWSNFSSVRV